MGIETILLGASLATSAVGTVAGMSAAGAAGANAASMAAYQAQVAENQAAVDRNNARASELDADRARVDVGRIADAGQRQLEAQGRSARAQIGQLSAEQSASGLIGGSQTRARDTLRFLAGLDRDNTRADVDSQITQGKQRVVGFETEAINYENRARGAQGDAASARVSGQFTQSEAASRQIAVGLEGFSTMLGTATSPMAQNWMRKRGWAK